MSVQETAVRIEKSSRRTAIARVVLDAWIEGKDGLTFKELAEIIKCSESTVRGAAGPGGFYAGCRYREGEVTTYSRNFPGMEHGVRRVTMLAPSEDAIRQEIKRLRGT